AEVDSILRHTAERGFFINDTDPIQADVKADIDDLGWTYLLLGDALELQGALQADVKITAFTRSEEHTSELQSRFDLVCRLLLDSFASRLCILSSSTRRSSDLCRGGQYSASYC